jgi:DNA polymerase-3 subunit epsilon
MGLLANIFSGTSTQIPEQWKTLPIAQLPLVSLDLELTSLDATESHITSCGWVEGRNNHCDIHSAHHFVLRTQKSLCQSPTIHGLTHEQVCQGHKLSKIFDEILPLLENKICVFHHAALDIAALKQACTNLNKEWPPCLVIDTLLLSKYCLNKKQQVIKHDDLTLDVCRKRLGLGEINLHNALDDAMATLELFYAFQHEMKIKDKPLKSLLHTGAVKNY